MEPPEPRLQQSAQFLGASSPSCSSLGRLAAVDCTASFTIHELARITFSGTTLITSAQSFGASGPSCSSLGMTIGRSDQIPSGMCSQGPYGWYCTLRFLQNCTVCNKTRTVWCSTSGLPTQTCLTIPQCHKWPNTCSTRERYHPCTSL